MKPLLTALAFSLIGFSGASADPLDPALFTGKASMQAAVDMRQLAPVLEDGEVADAYYFPDNVTFEGRLTLTALPPGGHSVVANTLAYGVKDAAALAPPSFSFALVQDGDHLYPTISGPVNPGAADWDVLVGPGHIWSDGTQAGRMTFPLTLKEPSANCLHNGLLTLSFDRGGLKPRAVYQIASETCAYFKYDVWGQMAVAFTPEVAQDKVDIVARRQATVAHRLKVRPLADLGIAPQTLLARPFGDSQDNSDPATSYGFVVDGIVYASDCPTRRGENRLCADTDLPSFSTAKSVFAGIGLMRLEALYPGSAQTRIRDLVPECSGWTDIRLIDALDMATGRYNNAAYNADEDSPDMARFFGPSDHAGKLAYACGHYRARSAPGQTFVYHTPDTYVLGTAMQTLYRQKTGKDVYDGLMRPLWDELNLSERLDYSQRTQDAAAQPFTGYGLVYRRDDILRIVAAFREGSLSLDATLRAEALQQTASRGLMAFPPHYRYQHGFWARNIAPVIGCDHEVWVPFMSGYGGITVALLPHDVTFYYFGDSQAFDWTQAIRTAHAFKGQARDLCT